MKAPGFTRSFASWRCRALCVAFSLAVAVTPSSASASARLPGVGRGFLGSIGAGALLPLPVAGSAEATQAPVVFVTPALPDAYHGWRRTPTRVTVFAPGQRVLYRWDADVGVWASAAETIVVPEGRHVLHLAALSAEEAEDPPEVTWTSDIELKLSFPSTRLRSSAVQDLGSMPLSDSVGVVVRTTVAPLAGPTLVRLGGRNRFETAALISKSAFARSGTIILATGMDFADALSSSGLAGSYAAPLLLTQRDALPAATLAEIKRLGAKKCVITGGTAAVSNAVASRLAKAGLSVQRLGGANRYETGALIAREIERREGKPALAFLARGDNFPDALAVSPFAFTARCPILLTRPTLMPASTRAILSRGYISRLVIAGGPSAVSGAIQAEVTGYVGSVSRAGGRNRYETATFAAEAGRSMGLTNAAMVGIATGANFPDALCGGVAAGRQGGCVLLTTKNQLPQPTGGTIGDYGPYLRRIQVYGGPVVVSNGVIDSLRTIIR